jgi:hypothetical protein
MTAIHDLVAHDRNNGGAYATVEDLLDPLIRQVCRRKLPKLARDFRRFVWKFHLGDVAVVMAVTTDHAVAGDFKRLAFMRKQIWQGQYVA